jgi:carboxyl-terminal processing protease
VRLTTARYHTPSGRCIQKPYDKGNREEYDKDLIERYNRGEFFSQDSIHQNEEQLYKTKRGRTVYGGGGIMPDIFVAGDTTRLTTFATEAFARGLISQFALRYSNNNRHNLTQYNRYSTLVEQLEELQLYEKFIEFAASKGLTASSEETANSEEIIKRSLYSNTIYQLLGMCEHVKFINRTDDTVLKAIEVLENGKAFPE